MEERINVAEILKDCPTGMELDCTMFYNAYLERVYENGEFPIVIKVGKTELQRLTEEGCWNKYSNAKCVIFPKGKTTWEGFHRPFKNGDILATESGKYIGIVKETEYESFKTYCAITSGGSLTMNLSYYFDRFATEEEKAKLFQAIEDYSYKWNEETKTLEKLIIPTFKVGDKVIKKGGITIPVLITQVGEEFYYSNTENSVGFFSIKEQDEWELVPDKFDISTLKAFDKVLVRNTITEYWRISLFGAIVHDDRRYFLCMANSGFYQCIPYEGNEHLLGTNNDCDDYFKTWEK